jgi:hypothetical protein
MQDDLDIHMENMDMAKQYWSKQLKQHTGPTPLTTGSLGMSSGSALQLASKPLNEDHIRTSTSILAPSIQGLETKSK